jgi:hypothetical protein
VNAKSSAGRTELQRAKTELSTSVIAREDLSTCPPHLLILGGDDTEWMQLLSVLEKGVRLTRLDATRGCSSVPGLDAVDIALVRAEDFRFVSGSLFEENAAQLALPEMVFVIDDPWSPHRFALESHGFRYIVTAYELANWLPTVLTRLCAVTRARRLALAAYVGRPAPPDHQSTDRQHRSMTLFAAETCFRDTFLRLLLAEHGSRRRAAEVAGVPYRSFCEMCRKLGI